MSKLNEIKDFGKTKTFTELMNESSKFLEAMRSMTGEGTKCKSAISSKTSKTL